MANLTKQLPSAVVVADESGGELGELVKCFYAVFVCSSTGDVGVLEKLMPAGGRNLYKSDYCRNRVLIVERDLVAIRLIC